MTKETCRFVQSGAESQLDALKLTADSVFGHTKGGWRSLGSDRQSIVELISSDTEALKASLFCIGDFVKGITGDDDLKDKINGIILEGIGAGRASKAAGISMKVRRIVLEYVKRNGLDRDDESMLMALVGKNGETVSEQGIVGTIMSSLIRVSQRVSSLLKTWYGVSVDTDCVLETICREYCEAVKCIIKPVVAIGDDKLLYYMALHAPGTVKVLFEQAECSGEFTVTGESDEDTKDINGGNLNSRIFWCFDELPEDVKAEFSAVPGAVLKR